MSTCQAEVCERPAFARGYCSAHYYRAFPAPGRVMPPIDAPMRKGKALTVGRQGYYRYNTHGITAEQWEDRLRAQDGKCRICSTELDLDATRETCVDHDHVTGVIRGLLCRKCNSGLGMFNDDVAVLQEAIGYLQEQAALRVAV